MKRFLQLAWAHICCDTYLLFRGMWRGECKVVTKVYGSTIHVWTATGSHFNGTLKAKRTFWDDTL